MEIHIIRNILFVYIWIKLVKSELENSAENNFREFSERYWKWKQEESPEYYSTYPGLNFTSNEVEQFSPQAYLNRKNNCSTFLSELRGIDKQSLNVANQLQYELLEYTFQTLIDGYEWVEYGPYNPINTNEDPLKRYMGIVGGGMRNKTVAGVEKILHWYTLIPQQVDNFIEIMNISIAKGTTNHEYSLIGVLDRFNSELAKDTNESTFSRPFTDGFLNDITTDQATRDRLKSDGLQRVANEMIPAFRRLRDFVRDRYSLHTRAEVGVAIMPRGQEYYRQLLKYYTTLDITPEDVHQLGLDEVQRIGALMETEVKAEGFDGTVKEFMVWYLNQSSSFYNTAAELVDAYQAIVTATHPKLSQIFKIVPTLPIEVVDKPNPQAPPGLYSPASIDGSRPGGFLVNTYDIKASPKMDMAALTMHEAEPGHHSQYSYSLQYENSPLYSRIRYMLYSMAPYMWPEFTSYSEGWGLYSEYFAEEIGAYTDKYSRLGKLNYEMWRATRLVVDTGMHYKGWTKEQAVNYMTEHTTFKPLIIENEVNRYISWPGQACAYKIGELKMRDLRTKAKQQMGSRFSLKEYHNEILKMGRVSLSVLEKRINAWMDESISGSPSTSSTGAWLIVSIVCFLVRYDRLELIL